MISQKTFFVRTIMVAIVTLLVAAIVAVVFFQFYQKELDTIRTEAELELKQDIEAVRYEQELFRTGMVQNKDSSGFELQMERQTLRVNIDERTMVVQTNTVFDPDNIDGIVNLLDENGNEFQSGQNPGVILTDFNEVQVGGVVTIEFDSAPDNNQVYATKITII